jgi:hypothetical protein
MILPTPWQSNKIENLPLSNKISTLRYMQHSAESIFAVEYLREYESIFETTLAYESVDPGVLFDEINQRSKIS